MSPTIVAQAGVPVLATGGAGGSRIIMGALETILDTVDFGQDLPHAVDAERLDDQGSATLEIEDARVDPAVLSALAEPGLHAEPKGEYAIRPRVQLAGIDPLTGCARRCRTRARTRGRWGSESRSIRRIRSQGCWRDGRLR